MHSWVTRKAPRGVQSTLAAACALMPTTPSVVAVDAGDEAGQGGDDGTREIERRGRHEQQQKYHGEHDESARRLQPNRESRFANRDICLVHGCIRRPPPIREAHPGEDVSGDRQREHAWPEIQVQRVEPGGRRGRSSECADPHRVEAEDQGGAAGRAGQTRAPSDRVGEDGAKAQGQRVGAAAGERGLDRQRRRAEQCHRHPALRAGQRQHDMRFGPAQAEQAEEAEASRHAPQHEANGVGRTAGHVRQHEGSPGPPPRSRRMTRPSSAMAARLLSLVEHEKMSMFTVPVSGQVCSTACDSLRIRTQVSPAPGKTVEQVCTTVAPARSRAPTKAAVAASGASADAAGTASEIDGIEHGLLGVTHFR